MLVGRTDSEDVLKKLDNLMKAELSAAVAEIDRLARESESVLVRSSSPELISLVDELRMKSLQDDVKFVYNEAGIGDCYIYYDLLLRSHLSIQFAVVFVRG